MTSITLLVELHYNTSVSGDVVAEIVSNALEAAIDDGQLMIMAGSSAGPNPPYEKNPTLISVVHELE